MERRFSNSDFERYVQDNADQYRMFPSEKVWNNVHNALHKRRRWYGLGLAFLLLLTGTAVTMVMRSYPVVKKSNSIATASSSVDGLFADETIANAEPTDIRDLVPFDESSRRTEKEIREKLMPLPAISADDDTPAADPTNSLYPAVLLSMPNGLTNISEVLTKTPQVQLNSSEITLAEAKLVRMTDYTRRQSAIQPIWEAHEAEPEYRISEERPASLPVAEAKTSTPAASLYNPAPYTIESVTNSYKPGPRQVSWQLFFTPTISYRALSVNKNFAGSPGGPLPFPYASIEDVNNAVTHKPDLGFQLGLMARYPVSKRVNLRAGLQLNVNKYDIKAFAYPGEVAVINLDDPNSTTVATWTRYRSQNGYQSNWLKNYYVSISVPLGAELMLFGNKNTQFGIAGTIQPTYVVRDQAYLISTDYKNYAQVPWLIRRLNMSTGFEMFVNYGKGKTRWQVGPQVRYQWLSSFQNKYPVKENLFDFGLKIGLTLNP